MAGWLTAQCPYAHTGAMKTCRNGITVWVDDFDKKSLDPADEDLRNRIAQHVHAVHNVRSTRSVAVSMTSALSWEDAKPQDCVLQGALKNEESGQAASSNADRSRSPAANRLLASGSVGAASIRAMSNEELLRISREIQEERRSRGIEIPKGMSRAPRVSPGDL